MPITDAEQIQIKLLKKAMNNALELNETLLQAQTAGLDYKEISSYYNPTTDARSLVAHISNSYDLLASKIQERIENDQKQHREAAVIPAPATVDEDLPF